MRTCKKQLKRLGVAGVRECVCVWCVLRPGTFRVLHAMRAKCSGERTRTHTHRQLTLTSASCYPRLVI